MSETSFEMPPQVIRYKGTFDYQGLLHWISDWFERYRLELHENIYKHKIPMPSGAEQEIGWVGSHRATDYIKFTYTVNFHIWDLTEIETEVDGKKKVMANCKIEIKVGGKVENDWQNMFERSKFTKMLHKIYRTAKWLELGDWDDILLVRCLDLSQHIKKFFGMETRAHELAGFVGQNR